MKKFIYLLLGLTILMTPLTSCNTNDSNKEDSKISDNTDTLDFELTNKTQVDNTNIESPSYSIEDDTLDDLLGSPISESETDTSLQSESIPENNAVSSDDDILDLLEQTFAPSNNNNAETENQPDNSIEQQETEEDNTSESITPTNQETIRKVPNTGIYPN